jgi:4-hydroxy-tetrahydrodipicolinate synthase
MYAKLEGVLSAPVTVFREDGEIDEDATREHIDYLIDHGITGLITLAVTGEFASLSHEERKRIIKLTVDHVDGRVPVIAGISDTNMRAVLELGHYAEDVGADGVFVLPPYLYSYTDKETLDFFNAIANEIKLHIQIYNSPATGRNLTPAMIKELSQVDNILSLKEGNSSQLADVISMVRDGFAVFCARDTYMLETLALGGSGVTSVTGSVVPGLVVKLYNTWQRGDIQEARKLQRDLLPLTNLLVKRSYPAGIKAGLDILGLKGGPPRKPLTPYGETEKQQLREALQKLGVLGAY